MSGARARSAAEAVALAEDPSCAADLMLALAGDRPTVQLALARNPRCTPAALALIATTVAARPARGWVAHRTLEAVATHPTTPPDVLGLLALQAREQTRAAVARNPATPGPVLDALLAGTSLAVKAGVAANPVTAGDRLAALARYWHPGVRFGAATNPAIAADDLVRLVADPSVYVRTVATARVLRRPWPVVRAAMLAHGPATRRRLIDLLSVEQLADLRVDPDRRLRAALASETDDPETLTVLASDPELLVRRRAGRRILASLRP